MDPLLLPLVDALAHGVVLEQWGVPLIPASFPGSKSDSFSQDNANSDQQQDANANANAPGKTTPVTQPTSNAGSSVAANNLQCIGELQWLPHVATYRDKREWLIDNAQNLWDQSLQKAFNASQIQSVHSTQVHHVRNTPFAPPHPLRAS